MRKHTVTALAAILCLSLLGGCSNNSNSQSSAASSKAQASSTTAASSQAAGSSAIRIAGLKGPTSMGLVKLMNDSEEGKASNSYEFTMAAAADEITPKLIKGDLDMAAVPANLASVLYSKTQGKVVVLNVNTLGVTYIVENGKAINSVADLKGKTIYGTGKGSIPEYALRFVLKKNGLDPDKDVKLEWKSEPTEVVALMKQQKDVVAMLPQPFVTVAAGQVENYRVALSITDEWAKQDKESKFITGVMVARKDFVEQNKDKVAAFLKEYEASIKYANENVEDAAKLVEKYDIVKAAVAKNALPKCNITFIAGDEMKSALSGFYKALFDLAPESVGGALPNEDIYYKQ
jgi:NitT/TauT family transport system substrate-binding protein